MTSRSHTRNRRRAIRRERIRQDRRKHQSKPPSKRRKVAARRAYDEVERVFAIFREWEKRP